MREGYVQIYTGNGKGKTTAALGLCLRALGAGLSVRFSQFIKAGAYSEIHALEALARALAPQAGESAASSHPDRSLADASGEPFEGAESRGNALPPAAAPLRLSIRQYGLGRFIGRSPSPEDIAAARSGLEEARDAIASGAFDLVVLDEANTALSMGLLLEADLLELIHAKPRGVELVLTGRGATVALMDAADLVSEMRELKHYYAAGIQAREGIER